MDRMGELYRMQKEIDGLQNDMRSILDKMVCDGEMDNEEYEDYIEHFNSGIICNMKTISALYP